MIGQWLSKLISIVRYILPSAINHIDDAGVLVTIFVPLCLVAHLLRMVIFTDTYETDNFNRKMLHNALTTIREREIQIKFLQGEIEKGKNMGTAKVDEKFESLQSELSNRLLEIQQMKTKFLTIEEQNNNLKAEIVEKNGMIEKERLNCTNLAEKNANLLEKNELQMKQLSEISVAVETSGEENERLMNEIARKNCQLTCLKSEANSHTLEIHSLRDQLEHVHLKVLHSVTDTFFHNLLFSFYASSTEKKMLHQRVEELQSEVVQLSEIISELRDAGDYDGGEQSFDTETKNDQPVNENGNGHFLFISESGWSDFDEYDADNTIDNTKQKARKQQKKERSLTTRFSPTDIMEVVKLRTQLKNVEAELEQAKLSFQKQANEREHLVRRVEFAESEATKRFKEIETKETERMEAHNQFKRILAMVEERESKLRNMEETVEKLRSEAKNWQDEVRSLGDQKKTVEIKLLEAEQEIKRLKAEYSRLETRNFHELRDCRQTIASLKQKHRNIFLESYDLVFNVQSIEQFHLSNPLSNVFDNANGLNLSASSSDRDYGASLSGVLGAAPLPYVRPLWSDDAAEFLSSHGESSLLRKGDPLLNDIVPENNMNIPKKGSRPRRSIRDWEHNTEVAIDGAHIRYKKEGKRMRSRSQGRHTLQTDYFPVTPISGYPAPPADYLTAASLNKLHSKSGTLCCSSGGSNDGRSPPPELALLSGVPPPGPMIKKPTPCPKSWFSFCH
ncbi:unnamed protein product [Thelazia callipaeda]|uniref:JNK/Rab-associated protein-1 N-terminal domain-containing protein n=1 Tax=Thelazia callipaeda TaxID=103827 RepID=A0A0N5D508_THECL|nr:unnamed protein product [Thelazia callipaeda]